MIILALVGAFLGYMLHTERSSAEAATEHVRTLNEHVHALEKQQQGYRNLMAEPQNAATLKQSDYLNTLFRRKSFSWTATMEDLETVLPSGVQVLSLEPQVRPDGHVVIHLRVLGPRSRGVDLIRNLEKSRYFAAPRLASESLATQANSGNSPNTSGPSYVNFDILADYRPLPHPVPPADEPAAAHPTPAHAKAPPKPAKSSRP